MSLRVTIDGLPAENVLDVKIRETEGQYAEIEIVREQTGFTFLISGHRQIVTVHDGGTLIARGFVAEMPADLLGPTQTLQATCAPSDIKTKLLEFAEENLAEQPWIDPLFSDFDATDPESYLIGRSAVYHVHPASHEISIVDDLLGSRSVNMADIAMYENGRARSSGTGEYGAPAQTIKGRLSVDYTQSASGICNVAPYFAGLTTLDPNFASNFQGSLTLPPAEGWNTSDDGITYRQEEYVTSAFDPGTVYQSRHEIYRGLEMGNTDTIVSEGQQRLSMTFVAYAMTALRVPMQFEYAQDRQETVDATLQIPVAAAGVARGEADIIECTLRDIFTAQETPDWAPDTIYKKDQHVRYNGKRYRSIGPHKSTNFWQKSGRKQRIVVSGGLGIYLYADRGYWVEVEEKTGEVWPGMDSFLHTDRGKACVQHLYMRMRKEGRRRLRAIRISAQFRWEDADHITLDHNVRLRVFEGRAGFRDVIGKVVSIEKHWPGDAPPRITIEIAVPIGSGGERQSRPGYIEPGYTVGSYDENARTIGDVSFSDAAGIPPVTSILIDKLSDPVYSVLEARYGGTAGEQLWAAQTIGASGGDVRKCTSSRPTYAILRMRPLPRMKPLARPMTSEGRLAIAARGL